MQTIYYTTASFIRHTGNVVDLEDYRRKLALTQEGSLAPQLEELEPAEWEEESPAPAHRRKQLAARPARPAAGLPCQPVCYPDDGGLYSAGAGFLAGCPKQFSGRADEHG